MRAHLTIVQNLTQWFAKYKCSASEESELAAEGEYDLKTGKTLFTSETKSAVENCKRNAQYLQDNRPIEEMYREVKAGPKSKHGLSVWLSFRGESKLEYWHDNFAHFGNSGMNRELCDSLNLCGTAKYNLAIRHKIKVQQSDFDDKVPVM